MGRFLLGYSSDFEYWQAEILGLFAEAPKAILFASLLAFSLSLFATLLLGRPTISWLRAKRLRDGTARKASETLNDLNSGKEDIPTMGGLFMVVGIVFVTLVMFLLVPVTFRFTATIIIAIIGAAVIGAYDDWLKLNRKVDATGKRVDGMKGRVKLIAQIALFTFCVWMVQSSLPEQSLVLWVPFFEAGLDLGWLALPIGVFVCVGTCNAVNLADGLDGLASGMTAMVVAAFAVVGYLMVDAQTYGESLQLHLVSTTILAAIVAGSCLGFLFYNRHPAKVFMGDTGSLALGAALGMIAVSMRLEILLAIAGAVLVAEALSVIIQVAYFKLSGGKRIFLCSPLHHHFQFLGWPERKVTRRFWAACAICCLIAIALVGLSYPNDAAQRNMAEDKTPTPITDDDISVSR